MRILLYKICLFTLLWVPFKGIADTGKLGGRYTKEKTINKEFEVNATALLKVSNSYGNLNITSWNENRIVIEVIIKTNGNNEEKVQEKLDDITVLFEASQSIVSAETIISNRKSGWGWNWGNNNNVNMQINYTIKLPVKNNVHLNNNYGSILLDRLDGHAKINCDYGRLEIGELHGRNNELNFDYTSKSSIQFINSGEIKADYSGVTIERAGDLQINADYTNITVEQMNNLDYNSDYGNLDIGSVKDVDGNGDYITVKIGDLHGNLDISADYGALRIKNISEDAGNITIRTDYTGVKLGYHPNYYFKFNITTSYAGVSGKEDFDINISTEKSSSKHYEGYYGSKETNNLISINSDYGNINFIKN